MPLSRRLIAAAIGLAVPLVMAATADAATRHRHHPAQVRTATYKVTPQKAVRHRHAAVTNRRLAQAAAHRHANMRGS